MERFETFFEEDQTVANEFVAEGWEKVVDWLAPNYKKALQKLRDKGKEAKTKMEVKDVLDDTKKLEDVLEAIIDDSQQGTMMASWSTAWQRFKVLWPLIIPFLNIPLYITNFFSAIKENTHAARKEKKEMGMDQEHDYLQKTLFKLAKGSIGDVRKLRKLLEEKLKKAKDE